MSQMNDTLMRDAQRLAVRFTIRMAAREAHHSISSVGAKTAHFQEITPEVLEAFGEFLLPHGKVAFGNIRQKLQQLGKVFSKSKKLWEAFKDRLGIKSLLELPGAIKDLAKQGYQALRKAVGKMFSTFPLKLFTLEESKLLSVNSLISQWMDKLPGFKKWVQSSVKPKVDQFDHWLRKYAPAMSRVLMLAVYIWIWMNVTEFEWDIHSLTDALTGALSLSDLLSSLPGSAIGFLMNSFGFGTFTLLPAALAARLLFLLGKRYLVWDGGLHLDVEKIKHDFGYGET